MPNHFLRSAIIVCCLLLVLPNVARAEYFTQVGHFGFYQEPFFQGARTNALGLADLATPTGPMAILQNPASQLEGNTLQVGFERSDWFQDWEVTNWALSGEWKFLRLGLVRHQAALWDEPLRTAYNPEGDDISFTSISRTWTAGLSGQVLPRQWREKGFSANIGANWRHYSHSIEISRIDDETGNSTDDADIGLTIGWQRKIPSGWIRLDGAAMKHNIFQSSMVIHPFKIYLPNYSQVGLTATGVWIPTGKTIEALRVLVAYSHRQESKEEDRERFHADRWGAELTVLEMVAFRVGDNDDPLYQANSKTMGMALIVPRRLINPLELRLNWTRFDHGFDFGWQDIFGATLSATF